MQHFRTLHVQQAYASLNVLCMVHVCEMLTIARDYITRSCYMLSPMFCMIGCASHVPRTFSSATGLPCKPRKETIRLFLRKRKNPRFEKSEQKNSRSNAFSLRNLKNGLALERAARIKTNYLLCAPLFAPHLNLNRVFHKNCVLNNQQRYKVGFFEIVTPKRPRM